MDAWGLVGRTLFWVLTDLGWEVDITHLPAGLLGELRTIPASCQVM